MLTPRLCESRCSALHLLRLPTQLLRVGCFLCLMVSTVIVSQSSPGQEPTPVAPADQPSNESSSSVKAKISSGQPSIEPLTRQPTESSLEIAPADQRIMSDIQEIRAMLGGGLKREFEEINQTLRQYPGATASPAGPSQANARSGGSAAPDSGEPNSDGFSRELGQMIRARSQWLPSADQVDPSMRQRGKSRQSLSRYEDRRVQLGHEPLSALRHCARELERVAGALEQIEAYENADTVRREAVKLWEKARNE